MLGYNEDGPMYEYDPDACARHLEQAWGGVLPETGFRFSLVYPGDDSTTHTIGAILQEQLSAINENYRLELIGMTFPLFRSTAIANQAPMFLSGWVEDFHDPHNWAQPYTIGVFAARQNMPEELRGRFQEVVEAGVATTDPEAREQAYFALQQLYHETAPAVILGQTSGYHIEPRYVEGWYYDTDAFTPMYALSLRSE
jgi:peptide/nickel transport system substrate-binding protein